MNFITIKNVRVDDENSKFGKKLPMGTGIFNEGDGENYTLLHPAYEDDSIASLFLKGYIKNNKGVVIPVYNKGIVRPEDPPKFAQPGDYYKAGVDGKYPNLIPPTEGMILSKGQTVFWNGVKWEISIGTPESLPTGLEIFSNDGNIGWKLVHNYDDKIGDGTINLMPSGDALQDNMVYVNGTKYSLYTTEDRDKMKEPEEGTIIWNKDTKRTERFNGSGWVRSVENYTDLFDTENMLGDGGMIPTVNTDGTKMIFVDPAGNLMKTISQFPGFISNEFNPHDPVNMPPGGYQPGDYYIASSYGDYHLFIPPDGGLKGVNVGDEITWNGTTWVQRLAPAVKRYFQSLWGIGLKDVDLPNGTDALEIILNALPENSFLRMDYNETSHPNLSSAVSYTHSGIFEMQKTINGNVMINVASSGNNQAYAQFDELGIFSGWNSGVNNDDLTGLEKFKDTNGNFGWKLVGNASMLTGKDTVNLTATDDAPQDNMVYVNGIKHSLIPTDERDKLMNVKEGTIIWNSDKNKTERWDKSTWIEYWDGSTDMVMESNARILSKNKHTILSYNESESKVTIGDEKVALVATDYANYPTVIVGSPGHAYKLVSEDTATKPATAAENDDGKITNKYISPMSATKPATQDESNTGTNDRKYISPLTLKNTLLLINVQPSNNLGPASPVTIIPPGNPGDYYIADQDGQYPNFNPPDGGLKLLKDDTVMWDGNNWGVRASSSIQRYFTSLESIGLTDDDLSNGDHHNSFTTILSYLPENSFLRMYYSNISHPNLRSIVPYVDGIFEIQNTIYNVNTIINVSSSDNDQSYAQIDSSTFTGWNSNINNDDLTGLEKFRDEPNFLNSGWKLIGNTTKKTGQSSVNLTSTDDALQDNMVYVNGIKYMVHTTVVIDAMVSEKGTTLYDADKDTLVQYNGSKWKRIQVDLGNFTFDNDRLDRGSGNYIIGTMNSMEMVSGKSRIGAYTGKINLEIGSPGSPGSHGIFISKDHLIFEGLTIAMIDGSSEKSAITREWIETKTDEKFGKWSLESDSIDYNGRKVIVADTDSSHLVADGKVEIRTASMYLLLDDAKGTVGTNVTVSSIDNAGDGTLTTKGWVNSMLTAIDDNMGLKKFVDETSPGKFGYKFDANTTKITGHGSVNLTSNQDASQDDTVYVNGIKYSGYTTNKISTIDAEVGTIHFDSDKETLVQCILTGGSPGTNVWQPLGSGDFMFNEDKLKIDDNHYIKGNKTLMEMVSGKSRIGAYTGKINLEIGSPGSPGSHGIFISKDHLIFEGLTIAMIDGSSEKSAITREWIETKTDEKFGKWSLESDSIDYNGRKVIVADADSSHLVADGKVEIRTASMYLLLDDAKGTVGTNVNVSSIDNAGDGTLTTKGWVEGRTIDGGTYTP